MSILTALVLAMAGQCTPEHAAMGHCKMPASAQPTTAKPEPMAKPAPVPAASACTAEHAALGHCKLPTASTPPAPAAHPNCPPEHAAMGHCKPSAPVPGAPAPVAEPPTAPPSAAALSGPEHAADAVWGADEMARVRRAVYAEHGAFKGSRVLLDRLEYRARDGGDGYAFEGEAWFGGDYDRLWLKLGGEGTFGEPIESAELQALFSRAIDPWFNLQAGVRQDVGHGPDRTHLVLGIQGLAPYWFEIDAAAFLSTNGELTARFEAEYDQRITNQLIVQPRLELSLSGQDVRELGLGAGLSAIEAGLRLRYEFVPEFAPYLGVDYENRIGRTARFARAAGEETSGFALVAGIRMWF